MPEGFRDAYRAFLRDGRILLTGHSHQAWPDVAEQAQVQAFRDAAAFVDDKWERAVQPVLERVARGVAERLGFGAGEAIAFGQNTHELVFRLLSCWPFDPRTHVVTTAGEFHSLDRQLRRLEEAGVLVTWVDAGDKQRLAVRLSEAITPGTSLVALSSVFFEDGAQLPGLHLVAERAAEVGAAPLVDAYHAFNVVPMDLAGLPGEVYVTAGGYKYAQFGEACCFLRIPPGSARRPLQTGWFADFADLARPRGAGPRPVGYGEGAARFAGSTFDAMPFYRAAAVLDHFDRFGLSVRRLRAISLRQTERILSALEAGGAEALGLEVASPLAPEARGGFVALRTERAAALVAKLREVGVYTDARGSILRLGPAPYLLDEEIDRGVELLLDAARSL
jgi:selenocysteine lyase/cysteine desulfurase